MKQNSGDEKQHAHQLIDQLSPKKLSVVVELLEAILDPGSQTLANVPLEDEDLAPEMAAVLERARASLVRGEGIPHDEILREFGLKK